MQCMQNALLLWANPSLCPSVRLSTAGIVFKRMDMSSSFFNDLVGCHSSWLSSIDITNSKGNTLIGGVKYTKGMKILHIGLSPFISETVYEIGPQFRGGKKRVF